LDAITEATGGAISNMCQCTPSIRTMFCHRGDCIPPSKVIVPNSLTIQQIREYVESYQEYLNGVPLQLFNKMDFEGGFTLGRIAACGRMLKFIKDDASQEWNKRRKSE
jgi:hypothetical protein